MGFPRKMRIPNYSNYFITQKGKIWSIERRGTPGHWLKPRVNKDGRNQVKLYNAAGPKTFTVRRVMMNAENLVCHQPPCPGRRIGQWNDDLLDDSFENVYWE